MTKKTYDIFSLETISQLIDILPLGILAYSSESGQCLFANQSALDILGATQEQLLMQNFYKIETWKPSGLFDAAEKAIKTKMTQVIEAHYTNTFNKNIWINAFFMTFDDKGEKYLMLIIDEITKIKSKEIENKNESLFLQALLEAIPNPIFYKNTAGIYKGCNEAFSNFLGKKREEIIEHTAYDIAPKELADIYHKADLDLMQTKTNQTYETEVEGKDGAKKNVIFNKAVYYDTQNNTSGLVGVILDITERKKTEMELSAKYEELKHMNDAMVDRENKMIELKNEIEKLKEEQKK